MKFSNHRAVDVPFKKARWTGGVIVPTLVVLHDTASRLEKGNAAAYLADNTAKVSVHFVLDRDGSLTQQVPVNRRANHAGVSTYHGRKNCNDFAIGIEIVNTGYLTSANPTEARAWFGQTFNKAEEGIVFAETKEHGAHLWMPYTEAQITTLLELLPALFAYIPTLQDIQGHWYVSPGRKVDPNPLFPMDSVRSHVLGREEPAQTAADDVATGVTPEEWVTTDTPGQTLNIRRWPSFNPNVITTLPDDTRVPVLKRGSFDGTDWLKVIYAGQEGWIVDRYTSAVETYA
jgi:N-acetylmuramoyl-L-alanine amidase